MSLGVYYLSMHVQWSRQLLQSELSSVFKLKGESKNIHGTLCLSLVPRTEPIMAAIMDSIVNRLIGMMNLLRYQKRLLNETKIGIRNIMRKKM
jgi:hypothetical protein